MKKRMKKVRRELCKNIKCEFKNLHDGIKRLRRREYLWPATDFSKQCGATCDTTASKSNSFICVWQTENQK